MLLYSSGILEHGILHRVWWDRLVQNPRSCRRSKLCCSRFCRGHIHTRKRVAIKKISDVFEHVSDATRILRELKLLRLLRHPDIVEIKHSFLPHDAFLQDRMIFLIYISEFNQKLDRSNLSTFAPAHMFLVFGSKSNMITDQKFSWTWTSESYFS